MITIGNPLATDQIVQVGRFTYTDISRFPKKQAGNSPD